MVLRVFKALDLAALQLAQLEVRWALVGGLAVSARSEPRLTRDVDLAVAVSGDEEAEAVVRGLVQRGWRIDSVLTSERTGRLVTTRMLPPGTDAHGVLVDLLFLTSGLEAVVVEQATPLELPGLGPVPVARTGHLLAMKVIASASRGRGTDEDDIHALLYYVADEGELALARSALRGVESQEPGLDLVARFDWFLIR